MIPLTLKLKNFLSYGQESQTIHFAPYHLICLSGKNGHGKSALLDAITWAIWGQARKITGAVKADEGLLRLGQTYMTVTLDFICNGQTYRIKREYCYHPRKPQLYLDFGIIDELEKTIRPLTDKTIRITQAKINQIIGLDYESFINSAFLRQGHAHEFSKKSPRERKEILATILGLNRYDALRRIVLTAVKHSTDQQQYLRTVHERLTNELLAEQQVQCELATITSHVQRVLDHEKKLCHYLEQLEQEKTRLSLHRQTYQKIIFTYEQHIQKKAHYEITLSQLFTQWRHIHRNKKKYMIESLLQEKHQLEEQLQRVQQQFATYIHLNQSLLHTQEQLQQYSKQFNDTHSTTLVLHQQHLETLAIEHSALTARLYSIEQQKTQLLQAREKIAQEASTIQKNLSRLYQFFNTTPFSIPHEQISAVETVLIKIEANYEKRKRLYHTCVTRLERITHELKQLMPKKRVTQDHHKPSCPLCEQELTLNHKQLLHTKICKQEVRYNHQHARLMALTPALQNTLAQQHTLLEKARLILEHIKQQHIALIEVQKNAHTIHNQIEVLTATESQLRQQINTLTHKQEKERTIFTELQTNIAQRINHDPTYSALKEHYTSLEQEITALKYVSKEQDSIRQRLYTVDQLLKDYDSHKEELMRQVHRAQEINTCCTALKLLKQELARIAYEQHNYALLLEKEQQIDTAIVQYKQELALCAEQKTQLIRTQGGLEQQIKNFAKLRQEAHEIDTSMNSLKITLENYTAIAEAVGKDGIPALLIEEALPEIEHEANILLSKLTDNSAYLTIDSLRDLKNGTAKETLDIKISDPAGTRPYELFSGGEAFRIDFALRIAISKLLARRAGTMLQTLIIDEGFGSQDEEGLQHIMDALYKIQDDFAKIIIVSHLNTLKNQFPVHFLVTKGPQGSTVRIIEQA